MADKQWGGYTTVANDMLTKVAANDFGADGTIKGGDMYVAVNPSYLAPAFYRVFAAYTSGDARTRWTTILDKSYALLAAAADPTTGLVPDWSSGPRQRPTTPTTPPVRRTGSPSTTAGAARRAPSRTPTRSARSSPASARPTSRTATCLNGTATGMFHNATFVGPAGAAGVAANLPTLVNDAYTYVVAEAKGSATNYFDRSWALFTVMLMTGTFNNLAGL